MFQRGKQCAFAFQFIEQCILTINSISEAKSFALQTKEISKSVAKYERDEKKTNVKMTRELTPADAKKQN